MGPPRVRPAPARRNPATPAEPRVRTPLAPPTRRDMHPTTDCPRPRFDRAYAEHAGLVRHVLRRFGVRPDQLDDASQDVFLVLHRRLSQIPPESSLRHWLAGAARRVAADHRRSQARRERRLRSYGAVAERVARADPADAGLQLHRLLLAIAPDRREVCVLAELAGFTAPEISAALGVKLNTVYSRLRAARGDLGRLAR